MAVLDEVLPEGLRHLVPIDTPPLAGARSVYPDVRGDALTFTPFDPDIEQLYEA